LVTARELGRIIAERSGLTLRTVKAVMDRGQCMDLMEAQQVSLDAISDLFQSEALQKGVRAFLEKRPAKP
jgi:enoyl-CoA hydratase/carnithine racemase